MKKLIIEIPEWAEGARIGVFAGMEHIASYNPVHDPDHIYIKETRCNMCGKCCEGDFTNVPLTKSVNGVCIYRHPKHKYCTLASNRPLLCCYDPNIESTTEGCCITHKKVPIEK